jgi:hypothetical protein
MLYNTFLTPTTSESSDDWSLLQAPSVEKLEAGSSGPSKLVAILWILICVLLQRSNDKCFSQLFPVSFFSKFRKNGHTCLSLGLGMILLGSALSVGCAGCSPSVGTFFA